MGAPLRLAVLEADTPLPAIDTRYHGYHGVFKHLFERAASPAPLESVLSLSRHHVVDDVSTYPSLEDVDAILITGSKHSAYENDEWITTLVAFARQAALHPRVRVIGVCFGHQIVSRALGGDVHRSDAGWEVSVTETQLTEAGKALFPGRDSLKIQQMHRDVAPTIPQGATLLATSSKCPNHGFLIPPLSPSPSPEDNNNNNLNNRKPNGVITVQGHPEFTPDIMREILETRHATGLFTPDVFEDGMARREEAHDGVLMARAFLDFLRR